MGEGTVGRSGELRQTGEVREEVVTSQQEDVEVLGQYHSFRRVKQASAAGAWEGLQSQRDSELMSCLVMKQGKKRWQLKDPRGLKGREAASSLDLVLTNAALPEPGAGGKGVQACEDPHRGAVGQL